MHKGIRNGLIAVAMIGAGATAHAATIAGTLGNGMRYAASNMIVGTTSTATQAAGGDPRYFATAPKYSGVVSLIMDQGAAGTFICSGSLLADRRSVVTAGHCVSGGAGTANPIRTTAYFYNGGDPDVVPSRSADATAIAISDYFVNAAYTGQVIDQNDIAVVRLSEAAPLFASSYDLYTGDLTKTDFNVAGYGRRSLTGGDKGVSESTGPGRLRQGDNRYEFRLGDPDLNGELTGVLSDGRKPAATTDNVYLADFDSGRAENDAACILTTEIGVAGGKYCDLGRGAMEATIAPGDSGGPGFVDGKLATVTSFGLTFFDDGDIDRTYNSSFGEYGGYVPVGIHAGWLASVMAVPEPSTWLLMLTGFGLVAGAVRRRRPAPRAA